MKVIFSDSKCILYFTCPAWFEYYVGDVKVLVWKYKITVSEDDIEIIDSETREKAYKLADKIVEDAIKRFGIIQKD